MKYLLSLMLSALTLFGSDADGEKYQKVPFTVPVDFSKKGTVYETDFQAPWNIWGSEVIFGLLVNSNWWDTPLDSEERKVNTSLDFASRDEKLIPKEKQQYFKFKVTLTPLGWASNHIEIRTIDYLKAQFSGRTDGTQYDWMYNQKDIWQKKEYKDGEKIEFITKVPLYGGDNGMGGKTIMIADLQRLRNYHIRVESLENVELPKGVAIKFDINRYSRKV
ncbi:hypothetical protein [Sulfurimonas sp.]|uniref:hypothetical protein n=1 Tax=Sulfurimonas sp. TaxID=2022749 RepID=UPI00286DB045|nr:hypothetical protein [Sulfurimonas sp.]